MKKLSIILFIFCILDMFFIEPNLLQIKTYNINDPYIKNLKIVFISDLHLRKNQQTKLKKIVNKINTQNPDIVLSTGDYINGSYTPNKLNPEIIAKELSNINAKYGYITVLGNHDCLYDEIQLIKEFNKNNLKILQNSNIYIEKKNLYIAGIEDDTTKNPNLDDALNGTKMPRILLMHSPDCYDNLKNEVSLVLAGHNHNGQICLPIIGPIFLPAKTNKKYAYGFYNDKFKKMIVTKGIGNSIINARFLCVPEIVVINFK